MSRRFFYLVPAESRHRLAIETRLQHLKRLLFDRRRRYPTGGVKVIYQHCEMLSDAGYDARPVHLGAFDIDWYPHRCRPIEAKDALRLMTEDDILVVPERLPAVAARFPCRTRIAFVQNQGLIEKALGGRRYEDFGFTDILCCSDHVAGAIGGHSALPRHVVTNGIDLARFTPDPARRRPGSVLMLQRKPSWRLGPAAIERLPEELRARLAVTILPNACSEAEIIRRYQEADVFLALGFPEGFALPPLEAMACGSAVVGFTGGGGLTHMVDGVSALIAPDGDVEALAAALERVLRDPELRERLRAGGLAMAQRFGLDDMRAALLAFAEGMQARG